MHPSVPWRSGLGDRNDIRPAKTSGPIIPKGLKVFLGGQGLSSDPAWSEVVSGAVTKSSIIWSCLPNLLAIYVLHIHIHNVGLNDELNLCHSFCYTHRARHCISLFICLWWRHYKNILLSSKYQLIKNYNDMSSSSLRSPSGPSRRCVTPGDLRSPQRRQQ